MSNIHTPVMRRQVTEYFAPSANKRYVDATVGAAGHTLELLAGGGEVWGIDQDKEVLSYAVKKVGEEGYQDRFHPINQNFSDALSPDSKSLKGEFDGILFDLGVSSLQLDSGDRGFSFRYDAMLDMRMDQSKSVTAADLVNGLGKKELAKLFRDLGEEKHADKIASAIVESRKNAPIKSTRRLAELISSLVTKRGKIHPATRVFQALRMAVNTEREELKAALPSALSWLKKGGILAVISFHSLEDKIVEEFLQSNVSNGQLMRITRTYETPSAREIEANRRSRSAKLRVAEKL